MYTREYICIAFFLFPYITPNYQSNQIKHSKKIKSAIGLNPLHFKQKK